jgi:hypothetical protein
MIGFEQAEVFAVEESRRLACKYGRTWRGYLDAFEKALDFWLPSVTP